MRACGISQPIHVTFISFMLSLISLATNNELFTFNEFIFFSKMYRDAIYITLYLLSNQSFSVTFHKSPSFIFIHVRLYSSLFMCAYFLGGVYLLLLNVCNNRCVITTIKYLLIICLSLFAISVIYLRVFMIIYQFVKIVQPFF